MRTQFWIVVLVVAAFLGFMMGYALPPFLEVGFGSGSASVTETQQPSQPLDQDMMQYYKDLYKQDNE